MSRKQSRKKNKISKSSVRMEYDYHLPVMLEKAVDYLINDTEGIYIDGTLGGGGHAAEILKKLGRGGKLLCFDKDEEAIIHCKEKFKHELEETDKARLHLYNESYDKACSIAGKWGKAAGILLDLGVSSRQLDKSSKGFTFRSEAPLDMRFGSGGKSAEELLNAASEEEIERILKDYGEEPFARVIARRITAIRRLSPIKSTLQLRSAVEQSVSPKFISKSLTRVFQAIRISVNSELSVLQNTLNEITNILKPNARIVVISYHSLEDRIVKSMFNQKSKIQRTSLENISNTVPELKIITKKPVIPDTDEIIYNPRSRSAKLRVAEKI